MARSRLPAGKCKVLKFGNRVVKICRRPDGTVEYIGPYAGKVPLTITEEEYKG